MMPLALSPCEVAIPELSVSAVLLLKLAPAPDVGGVKVTCNPRNGLPPMSVINTVNRPGKVVFTGVLCGVPLTAEMAAGLPTILVKPKALVLIPATVALTL